jgi:ubiquinone/menaquinone biosynthesis C-methylase UbiE
MSQQQTVIQVFDRFSGDAWDALYDEHAPAVDTWKFIQRKLRVEELLATEKPGRLLDVGCGTGVMAPTFLERGWEFVGVDIAPKMIEHARRRFAGQSRAQFHAGTLEALKWPAASFDAVMAMGLVEYLNDEELRKVMHEMARLLKPDGALVVSAIQPNSLDAVMRRLLALPTRLLKPFYLKWRGKQFNLDTLAHRAFAVRELERWMAEAGCVREDHAFYNVLPVPFPFDKLAPRLAAAASRRAEPKQHDHYHWAATAYMLKARKRNETERV